MELNADYANRALRDISDGVMVITDRRVSYMNESAEKMLNVTGDRSNYMLMIGNDFEQNEAFHQLVIDAIYDKEHTHTGDVTYQKSDGSLIYLQVKTSFLLGENKERLGIVVVFSDITAIQLSRKKDKEVSVIFAGCVAYICTWVILTVILQTLEVPIFHDINFMSALQYLMSVPIVLYFCRNSSLTWKDMGLSTKNLRPILTKGLILGIAALAVMVVIKIVMLHFNPGFFRPDRPFFDLETLNWTFIYYPLTVVYQEFMARGIMQNSLQRIFKGEHSEALAIIFTALTFSTVHVHRGWVYVLGAAIMVLAFGTVYARHKTIWGVCIPHLVMGVAVALLGFKR